MPSFSYRLCALLLLAVSAAMGCHAQPPAGTLTPELARRVEILIRSRTKLPPEYALTIGPRTASEVPGYSSIAVTFKSEDGQTTAIPFLLSNDGKTVAQFNKYDITKDPKMVVSNAGRPVRGGPEGAPVDIVVFDDLECPFCARLNAQMFPTLTERYGKNVRIAYRDLPSAQHPWAMRAAVDVNCVAAQNPDSYWKLVDYIHEHAPDFGGPEHSLAKANQQLDELTADRSKKDGLRTADVQACVAKQDQTAIQASIKLGETLDVEATPVLFVNGERIEGAYPLADIFHVVDRALKAEGTTPPPPYVAPAKPADAAPAAGAAAPGNKGVGDKE